MHLLFTTDGDPVFRKGFEKYTLTCRHGAVQLKLPQVTTLLPPETRRNRDRLALIKKQTGKDCVWRDAA